MKHTHLRKLVIVTVNLAGFLSTALAGGDLTGKFSSTFYKDWPLFSPYPDEGKSAQTIDRFGPVGISIELYQPAFQMRVKGVEQGSPAEATGKLKPGMIIETINGQPLKDVDPRIQLGGVITQAEATDGKVRLMIKAKPEDKAEEVVVQIPVLGAYSPTWPLNCPKSDKIVRNMADYLVKTGNHAGPSVDLGLLFMLSTGEDKDLEVARGWVRELVEKTKDTAEYRTYPWYAGWGGLGLCEYYLRTGDESVLPLIEKLTDYLRRTMYNNGWSQRGGANFAYYSGGHLNAAGVQCVTTLLLAKRCGAKVDEYTLQSALRQFYRFAGHGNTPYGDHLPESGFVDNGKVGGLAFTMAAAASLTPDGENSAYAKARDICAVKGFYSTSWMLHGHTGGGIGEIWRSGSMGLMYDKKPAKYREFMDHRMWHYELSRRFDGSFGILGGERYDDPKEWGINYALTYTIPRKTLQITGAKPTKYCKSYQLPVRPWGTETDEAFFSLVPAPDKSGKPQDVDAEKLPTDASWPIYRRLNDPTVSDETLLMYCRHPDQGVREMAYGVIRGLNRDHLIVELLKDKDTRARHSGAMAITTFSAWKARPAAPERLTDEMAQLLIGIVNDPNESWWTVRAALTALSLARAELLAPHVERLCYWLQSDEWWMQSAALSALAELGADPRYYKQVLPLVGKIIAGNRVMTLATQWGPMGQLRAKLQTAPPEVQSYALQVLGQAYSETPVRMSAPGGVNLDQGSDALVAEQAAILGAIPGGLEELYKRGRQRHPEQLLPHKELLLAADPAKFDPELRKVISDIIREQLIYEYMGKNWIALLAEASPVKQAARNFYPKLGELVALYDKIDVKDYDWHGFGPDTRNGNWDYFTFDPPEKEAYDLGGWRYRKVTLPAGMEKWFEPNFDAPAAGWKKGQSPFGQKDGKLIGETDPEVVQGRKQCPYPYCGQHDPMHTFWDKEVLLMRGSFQFPPLKPGHVYRLVIGPSVHLSMNSGFRLYLNGKQLVEDQYGIGKREGGSIRGAVITTDLYPEFAKGPVTLAATSFLLYKSPQGKPPMPQGIFSVWMEEMKLPPLDDAMFQKSATMIPMLSADWQSKQNNPDTPEVNPADGMYKYEGKFVANPQVLGDWQAVAVVPEMAAFDPAKPSPVKNAPFKELTLKDGGLTGKSTMIWSGDILMDLGRFQVLQMTIKGDYLFVEAGGFSEKNTFGWKSPLVVMKKKL